MHVSNHFHATRKVVTLREKNSRFGVIQVHIFHHSDWIRRDTQYLSVFSPNAGKYEPEYECHPNIRSSRSVVFCKIGVLRNHAKFIGKHLGQSLFLIKLQAEACNFINEETGTGVFLWILRSKNNFSYRTPPVAASVMSNSV